MEKKSKQIKKNNKSPSKKTRHKKRPTVRQFCVQSSFNVVLALFLILVLACSFFIFIDVPEKLEPRQYPSSWHEANRFLNERSEEEGIGEFKVLFLPWHGYLTFDFTDGERIANPAKIFFDVDVIQAKFDDSFSKMEEDYQKINEIVMSKDNLGDSVSRSENHSSTLYDEFDVRYVIVSKVADYKKFENVYENLTKVYTSDEIDLYLLNNT